MSDLKQAEEPVNEVYRQVRRSVSATKELAVLMDSLLDRLKPVIEDAKGDDIPRPNWDGLCPLANDLADVGDNLEIQNNRLKNLLEIIQL